MAGALAGGTGLVALLGQAGLVGAAGAAGYAVGSLLVDPIDDLVSKLTGSKTTLGGWIYDITHAGDAAEEAGQGVTKAAVAMEEAKGAIERSGKSAGGASGSWEEAGKAVKGAGDAARDAVNPYAEANQKLLDSVAASEKAAAGADKLAGANKAVAQYVAQTVPIIDAATGKVVGYEQQLVAVGSATAAMATKSGAAAGSLSKISDATGKAVDQQRRWNEELLKMQHAEKMKLIEQATAIAAERIKANAQVIQAAFESINTTISSTGELLGSLYGELSNQNSSTDYYLVRDQIEQENQRRQEALDMQKELTRAQIDELRARTKAVNNGDALIKIDGAGLQPHLEAFMWEILRTIQTRVNKDGMELLLGA
jgi:hypothetical protein